MPPVEAWKKVLVQDKTFMDTTHGKLGCITCHGGTSGATDEAKAHEGLAADPAAPKVCGTCHPEQAKAEPDSLHFSLKGYYTAIGARSDAQHMPQLTQAFDNHCTSCHTTCGDCHVSRPQSVGGGLLNGHTFKKSPP